MGWLVPEMSRIPLIHGPDGAKLSTRQGALGVEAYRQLGYLPEALRNYLARLGWSHGDEELFSTEQMVEWFSLEALNKGAARFDFVKLENINGHYIRQAEPELQPRAKTVLELIDLAQFIYAVRPLQIEESAAAHLTADARANVGAFAAVLQGLNEWSVEAIDAAARAFAEERGLKLGKVAQPLRAALTGRTVSPGIFEVMVLIGREETLARLGDQAG